MGKKEITNTKSFTKNDIVNKDLVIKMLQYEEMLTKSEYGQNLYKNILNSPLISLNVEKTINRLTLDKFGFNTTDDDVNMYRTIFRTYYSSPFDYDKDVLDSVHYMRENKCVYYKVNPLNVGDSLPNCTIYNLDGRTQIPLHDIIKKKDFNYTLIGAFSLS